MACVCTVALSANPGFCSCPRAPVMPVFEVHESDTALGEICTNAYTRVCVSVLSRLKIQVHSLD